MIGKFNNATLVREILMSNERVKELVGDKIFPVISPEGTDGDRIVVIRDQYVRERAKCGVFQDTCIVSVIAYSHDYDRSVEIISAVDMALEEGQGNSILSDKVPLTDSEEGYVDNTYYQLCKYIL